MTTMAKGIAGSLTQLTGESVVDQPTASPIYFIL
ncbi:hypothetical protein Slin_6749 (plasmid) [Spirosoma linguale DSM 74]|uniref:Uncharacterized protein n=1 Tax=Spirosoma linguale (strain ATCC 33905 / DSM 74 / LMG 10896 / Claus 1) TaxID=504472 RepID=D2QV73_SPILD|nr:hypothetical protein Slin_6749 [Spirosoma linguale DSM 74]